MHHSFDISEPPEAQQGHTFQTNSQGKREPEGRRLTSARTAECSLPPIASQHLPFPGPVTICPHPVSHFLPQRTGQCLQPKARG